MMNTEHITPHPPPANPPATGPVPDWMLPPGVDRGLWDYLHADEMIRGYDEQMAASPLAQADVAFCEAAFPTPGRLLDLGCGTGRLCGHFAVKGYECVGVDLSDAMLAKARENAAACLPRGTGFNTATFHKANLVELPDLPGAPFDYAACLFSTLGMVGGAANRAKVIANAFRLLRPGGRFVLHVHHRYYLGLGWKRVLRHLGRGILGRADAGDTTMSQAYGGAPLTLHHFTRREAVRLLTNAGFTVRDVRAVGVNGEPARMPSRVYGYLLLAQV